jgi:DNA-binding winged helix-turn-helix (wHTH) protein
MTKRVSFGPFVLDADTRELLGGADPSRIHLTPRALELLLLLVAERPRAMSKQELHERVWPDTFVSEATLASVISELREALGERGRNGHYLRTVHGFGYAFSADARELSGPTAVAVSHWLICDGREQPLNEGVHIIGRDVTATLQLQSPTVSRQHAKIVVENGVAVLEDLHSKNGTYVNGEAVESPIRLADGDEIRIGAFQLAFRIVTSDGVTATAPT